MTFADLIDKPATERFPLIRVTPARCIDSSLILVGAVGFGIIYKMPWTQPIASLQRNGTSLTKVTGFSPGASAYLSLSASDQYIYDEDYGTLWLAVASAPSDTTNVIVLFYRLFFTSGLALLATEDPLDSSTPLRQWEPRVTAEPRLTQTAQNIISGIMTIADTAIDLANGDASLNQWLGSNDSFNSKDVDCWLGIREGNSQQPIFQRIYKGKVKAITSANGVVSLSIYDAFSTLWQPAFMGDSSDECYFGSSSYPNSDPNAVGKAVPFYIGKGSRYTTRQDQHYTLDPNSFSLDPAGMDQAVCTGFTSALGVTVNRTWTLGRCPSEGFRSWSMTCNSTGLIGGTGVSGQQTAIVIPATFTGDVGIGDCFKWTDSTNGTHYARVTNTPSTTVQAFCSTAATITSVAASAVTITTFTSPVLILVDENGIFYHLMPELDYSTTVTTTSGGNSLVSITLVNNFEARLVPANGFDATFSGPLDPTRHRLYFRLRLAASAYAKHGDVLSNIMTIAGLSVNSSSFSAANTALPVNCAMSIPYYDESTFRPYLDYVEDILASTLGFVALDASAQATYALLAAPSASDGTDDHIVLADTGLSITVDYSDIVTGIIAYNPHNASVGAIAGSPSPNATKTSKLARYLHGIVNDVQFRHVLETITGRIDQILAARSNRRATYVFNAATRYLNAKIGDDAQLTTGFLLGSDTARSVKIVGLDKSADQVAVQGIDLLGVT